MSCFRTRHAWLVALTLSGCAQQYRSIGTDGRLCETGTRECLEGYVCSRTGRGEECVLPGSLAKGETCDNSDACRSGVCGELRFSDVGFVCRQSCEEGATRNDEMCVPVSLDNRFGWVPLDEDLSEVQDGEPCDMLVTGCPDGTYCVVLFQNGAPSTSRVCATIEECGGQQEPDHGTVCIQ